MAKTRGSPSNAAPTSPLGGGNTPAGPAPGNLVTTIPGPARMGTLNLDDEELLAEFNALLAEDPGVQEEALEAANEMVVLPMDALDKRPVVSKRETAPEGIVDRRAPGNPLHSRKNPFYTPEDEGLGLGDKKRKIQDPALESNPLRGRLLATVGVNSVLMFVFFQTLIYNFLQTGEYYVPYSENSMVGPSGETLFELGGVNTNQVRNGQPVRLFWGMWMHSGWIHIGFNVLCQLQYMYMLEPDWGFIRTLLCFWFAGMTGNFLSSTTDPCKTTVGSSGGLFGLMGGIVPYIIEYWRSIPRPCCILVFSLIVAGVSILTSLTASTDAWAHIGGFGGGILFGMGTITSFSEILPREQHQRKRNLKKNSIVRWLQAHIAPDCRCGWLEWLSRIISWSLLIVFWSICIWLIFKKYDYRPVGSLTFSGVQDCACCYDLLSDPNAERNITTWFCAQTSWMINSTTSWEQYCGGQV